MTNKELIDYWLNKTAKRGVARALHFEKDRLYYKDMCIAQRVETTVRVRETPAGTSRAKFMRKYLFVYMHPETPDKYQAQIRHGVRLTQARAFLKPPVKLIVGEIAWI